MGSWGTDFGRTEDDKGPAGFDDRLSLPRSFLDLPDLGVGPLEAGGHVGVQIQKCFRVVFLGGVLGDLILDEADLVAVSCEEADELEVVHRSGDGAFGDLASASSVLEGIGRVYGQTLKPL
jgi:hypothetical protein